MNITILGAGAWGTALALSLAGRNQVVLWGRNEQVIHNINQTRQHQGFTLPASLIVSSDLHQSLAHLAGPDSLLIIGTSVSGLRPVCQAISSYPVPNVVWLCKGLEENTLLLPHQIVEQELGKAVPCGVLSGPSFAQEVAKGQPCALTIDLQQAVIRKGKIVRMDPAVLLSERSTSQLDCGIWQRLEYFTL